MAFSCLSHGRAELGCKDCREGAIEELMRLIRKTRVKETKSRQALLLAIDAIKERTA